MFNINYSAFSFSFLRQQFHETRVSSALYSQQWRHKSCCKPMVRTRRRQRRGTGPLQNGLHTESPICPFPFTIRDYSITTLAAGM